MSCISPHDDGGVKVVVRGLTVSVRTEIEGVVVVGVALVAVDVTDELSSITARILSILTGRRQQLSKEKGHLS